MNPAVLAVDTSTTAIAVALRVGPSTYDRSHLDARGHTEHLAPLIAGVLHDAGVAPAELSGIVVGTGPGPFTGLRVGLVTAVTMGYALQVPVHGVCSLDALAAEAAAEAVDLDATEFVVATDARRREVYWARYAVRRGPEGALAQRVAGPEVGRPAELSPELKALPVCGRGARLYEDLLGPAFGPLDVDAAYLIAVADRALAAGEPMPVEPLYLRRPDALTTAERAAR